MTALWVTLSREDKAISGAYGKLMGLGCGAVFRKVDLHVHTPGSGDAQASSKYGFSYEKRKGEAGIDKEVRDLAGKIVEACAGKGLSLIAVTDHNSPGYLDRFDISSKTWHTLIRRAVKESKGKLVVLPGCEISTDDAHVLAILPPEDSVDKDAYSAYRIAFMLRECNFKVEDYGILARTGSKSVVETVRMVNGSGGIGIPAHIDGGNKAMLDHYKKAGEIYVNLMNEPGLNVLEIVNKSLKTSKRFGKNRTVEGYFNEIRKPPKYPIAFMQNSDGHSLAQIGKRFTHVKMEEPSFSSLQNALNDPETRLRLEGEIPPSTGRTFILGMCIKKNGAAQYVRFNENLNCIVGRLGSYKSTVLKLLTDALGRVKEEEKEGFTYLKELGYGAQVFVKRDAESAEVYCFSKKCGADRPAVYKLGKGGEWAPVDAEKTDLKLPRFFNLKLVMERFGDSDMLIDFLRGACLANTSLEKGFSELQKEKADLVEKIKGAGDQAEKERLAGLLKKCMDSISEAEGAFEKEFKRVYSLRSGEPLLELKTKKGAYQSAETLLDAVKNGKPIDDVLTLYLVCGDKKKKFESLAPGEKNAVAMIVLMSQDSFGPLVIDEPESFLDTEAISGHLVPRLRDIKANQQLIVATSDPDIVVLGDCENVIVAEPGKQLKIVENGDIYKESIRSYVLDTLEGGAEAVIRRGTKLNAFQS
jgi:PHP family Zn ribbon phosphoesterase